MVVGRAILWCACLAGLCLSEGAVCCAADAESRLVTVRLTATDEAPVTRLMGRILMEAQDGGVLLEERNGTLHNLTPDRFESIESMDEVWLPLDADQLSAELVAQLGPQSGVVRTDHFVICSDASEVFVQYCSQLLEAVYREYFQFCAEIDVPVAEPGRPLPVIIFRRQAQLRQYAAQQHPETSFENVTGYYSSRFNQMYVSDPSAGTATSRRRLLDLLKQRLRHTETIVHEAFHLLAYNTGLHVRQADNPLWYTEGLAAWFEPASGRGTLLWSGPGRPNATHLSYLRSVSRGRQALPSLEALLQDNKPFLSAETVQGAYAASWAATYYLLRREPKSFQSLADSIRQRPRLQEYAPAQELAAFAEACDEDEVMKKALRVVLRLRAPRR